MNEPLPLDFISRIYFLRDHTLFLTGEARDAVRFFRRQSPYNPKAII
jgi:hypothetical protein